MTRQDAFDAALAKLRDYDYESTQVLFRHIIELEREHIKTHGLTLITKGA